MGKKIDHVGIMVKDIEKSIKFYEDVVGFKLKAHVPHSDSALKLAFLGFEGSDETELELIQGYNDSLPAEGKVHHLAVTVDNIEEEFDRVKALDVKFVDDHITVLPNGYRYFFIYGPEGEWVEFFQR
ncbi:VOC family protein [Bacillus sp. 31A1R]|uniref:VOC family protein n=1 Tax=Robertmurraya mangrovi TaxID=3098077 RepID=A0ABU5IWR0_9BACI|nr:VOC family protein [Bacillus sp. 31A1R]MDZ5471570.1 VOC family protein [Bacillus sp. 31A1R]